MSLATPYDKLNGQWSQKLFSIKLEKLVTLPVGTFERYVTCLGGGWLVKNMTKSDMGEWVSARF